MSNIFTRLKESLNYSITGVKPDTWMSPLQPIQPIAQEAKGRIFDYSMGYNIKTEPKQNEGVNYEQLRALSENCSVLATVIETRKDQIKRKKIGFRLKNNNSLIDKRCKELDLFFKRPDGEHTWSSWIGSLLNDLLILDAPTIYPVLSYGGKVLELRILDGSTIVKKIDANGRVPKGENDVAYQQRLKGMPAIDYTYDELILIHKNPRSHTVYGYSPVEQIINIVNIAIRRELNQLSFFVDGNTPNLIFRTPEKWNAETIQQYQTFFDEIITGQSKHRAIMVPSGVEPINTKPIDLKNDFDEWLARIICYAFNVDPKPFVKEMNRATSEVSKRTSEEDGILPIMQYIEELMNFIILKYFNYDDIEFYFHNDFELDPYKKAQTHDIYLKSNVLTINEVRKDIGLNPIEEKEKIDDGKILE